MQNTTTREFVAYWEAEGEAYARHGDYDWMASLVPGRRVLEIGCGAGFGTVALARRGFSVLAVDNLPACLEATRSKLTADFPVRLLAADVIALTPEARSEIEAFSPDALVCWLMGAPAELTDDAAKSPHEAVSAYREKLHRAVAELAAALPSVAVLHLVDRTAIAWQAKEVGRDTLVRYHLGKTLLDLPFSATRGEALFRRLELQTLDLSSLRNAHPALKKVVPVVASLLATRTP